jgi:hypothetical protein
MGKHEYFNSIPGLAESIQEAANSPDTDFEVVSKSLISNSSA